MTFDSLTIITFSSLVSSLPIAYFSYVAFYRRRNWYLGLALLLSIIYVAIWGFSLLRMFGVLPVCEDLLNSSVLLEVATGISDNGILFVMVLCGLIIIINNAVISWSVKQIGRHRYVWRFVCLIIVSLLISLLFITFFISLFSGRLFTQVFFDLCCGIMAAGAYSFGLTYKEFCVIGNIYLQGIILVISALVSIYVIIRKIKIRQTPARYLFLLITILYSIFFLFVFCKVCTHYYMPLENAFDLCVQELQTFGSLFYNIGYIGANILIFVIGWLALFLLNVLFAYVLNKSIN